MKFWAWCWFIGAVLGMSSCRSVVESTHTETRDTVIVFTPSPIDTVFLVGETPSGVHNPDCDTLLILNRYGSFDLVSADKHYTLQARYDASIRRLRVLETRPVEQVPVIIESIYKQTKIVKDGLWDRLKTGAVGAVVMFGLGLIAIVVLKIKGII